MAAVAHRQMEHASGSRVTSSERRDGESRGASVSRKRTNGSDSRRDDAKMIGQWRIGRTIGKGSSGRVKIAKHAITGKYAAIKIVPKGLIISSRLSVSEAGARADKVLLGIEREIVIMKLIDHPNVLNLYDVWETSSELYLIMEYVPGGELFDYLVKRGRLPISEALHYFQQIIHAVDYCHRFNICHRDLKPENLLLDKDKNIKVADFGMAAWEAGERMLETSCGSPHYASPEIVAGKAYHGSSSDIWSCGIILFALLTGRLPFDDDNIRSLLQKVKVGTFEMPNEIKDPARNLLFKMLEKDPERRITMPDILVHPFFTSRAPRPIPGRALVSPPSLDEVERPVNSPDEIDPDIMGNLKTLWSGASDEQIIAALMSRDKTWEKAIYHLLVKYRNKHLENYNMDDEEDSEALARRQARRAAQAQSGPSPPKRKGGAPVVTARPQLTPLKENDTVQERVASPIPARPAAPTPKKAAAVAYEGSPAPSRPTSKLGGPGAALALTPRSPAGPRPPLSNRGSSYAPSVSSETSPNPMTPSIVLQEATPTKEMIPPTGVHPPARPLSLTSSPLAQTVPNPLESPSLQINVPQVQDERLQHFFNEVANQLNSMNIRSSVASGSSSSSAILGSEYQAYLAFVSGGSASGPSAASAGSAIPEEELNQFADADDDNTDAGSIHSFAPSVSASVGGVPQYSPLVGLGIGGPPAHGGGSSNRGSALYPAPPPNPQRWSYQSAVSTASSARSPHAPFESPVFTSPSPSAWAHPELSPANGNGHAYGYSMQAQRAAPLPPPRMASRAPPPPPLALSRPPLGPPRPTVQIAAHVPLPREGSYVVIEDAGSVASDPMASWGSKQSGFGAHRGQDAFGMLKKKKKNVTIEPVAFSPDLSGLSSGGSTPGSAPTSTSASSGSGATSPSPKRSWFNNLFSFKPAPATLTSPLNISETREKAKKLLADLNVRVAVDELEAVRALKCRLDEVRDLNGTVIVKGVLFRVEFARGSPANTGWGYNTTVSLTQEKGAQSAFKDIFASLRTSFGETTSSRPPVTHAHSYMATSPRPGQTSSGQHLTAPPVRYTSSAPTSPVLPSTPRFSPQIPGSPQLPATGRF